MKELSTEEKAKLYDKIIEFAYNKHRFSSNLSEIKLIEEMFPELYESEDERIRKEIINYFKCQSRDEPGRKNIHNKWINWLNCIKISSIDNTDNSFIDDIKNIIYEAPKVLQADKNRLIDWLEKQDKPQIRTDINIESSWDEEDEKILQGIWDEILANKHNAKEYEWKTYDKFLDWLKSLRPQNQWKPTEEQMHYLYWIANVKLGDSVVEQEVSKHLNELHEDLKKLKGE